MTDEDIKERRDSRDRLIRVESTLTNHVADEMHMYGEVRNTVNEVKEVINEVKNDVQGMREASIRQASAIENLIKTMETQMKVSNDLEKRMSALEMRIYGITLVVMVLWNLLGDKIKGLF